MAESKTPALFQCLLNDALIGPSDLAAAADGFSMITKSVADILSSRGILDFPDADGQRFACDKFYDDWFVYAVPSDSDCTYSLVKLREQEHDTEDGAPADGDTPGVTICFIAFDVGKLLACLADPCDENRRQLDAEINRVVAYRGQRHHKALKQYFKNPRSMGAYLVAGLYVKAVASYATDGKLPVPEAYQALVQRSLSYKHAGKAARLPRFIAALNRSAGYVVCDNESICLKNRETLTEHEALAILATHTGNTSVCSLAAEVEYHAKFLTPWAKIKIPFFGSSIYSSAIRADMTVGDTEFEGPAPFHKPDSKIVKRQRRLHPDGTFLFPSHKQNI